MALSTKCRSSLARHGERRPWRLALLAGRPCGKAQQSVHLNVQKEDSAMNVPKARASEPYSPSRRAFLAGATCLLAALALVETSIAGPAAREIFADRQVVALIDAATKGNTKRAAELVAAGANVSARGDRDVTLLQWVMLNKSRKGFAVLLYVRADPAQPGIDGDTAVHFAAMANDPEYLRLLLAHGVNVDVPNTKTGRTPLMSAMIGERDRQFDMLLVAGASTAHADNMGNTSLHVAAQINAAKRLLRLLEAGAPAAARNAQGKTFQTYLFMTPEHSMSAEARLARQSVVEWLHKHGIAIEK